MARFLTLALVGGALLSAPGATAAGRTCDLGSYHEVITHVRGVSCQRAEKVIRAHLDGVRRPFGFTCRQKPDAPSVFITCRKGEKRFRYESE